MSAFESVRGVRFLELLPKSLHTIAEEMKRHNDLLEAQNEILKEHNELIKNVSDDHFLRVLSR